MKSYEIKGEARESMGTTESKRLRSGGMIPCVIYGVNEPIHFAAPEGQFRKLVNTADVFLVHIEVGGKTIKAVMQELQFHPVTDRLLHIDFIEVVDGEPVKVELPVATVGTSEGVRLGGNLSKNYRKLKVSGMVADLPERLEINIETLKIGEAIRVRDLSFENIELLNTPSDVVIAVKTSRKAMAAATADGEEGEEEKTEEAAAE